MIRYALRCGSAHGFEAWFRSGADYVAQSERGLLSCPSCGDQAVVQALMAPAVVSGRRRRAPSGDASPSDGNGDATPQPTPGGAGPGTPRGGRATGPSQAPAPAALTGEAIPPRPGPGAGPMPDAMRAMLSRVREEIERSCDDVGHGFADEAIRMHRGESDRRGIYGKTTEADRQLLEEEGVEVARIPWVSRNDG